METPVEIRIAYSQNGREISDELFRIVPFFWKKQDELDAKTAAKALAMQYGCGMAEVYVLSHKCKTGIGSFYGMDYARF